MTSDQRSRFTGLVHTQDGKLVDGVGRPLVMRGVGIGNWMLPEGYMWLFEPGPDSPRLIEQFVADLAGDEFAAEFWPQFYRNFFTREDVSRIAAEGFDHVRLPINWRLIMTDDCTPIDAGLALIDDTIAWCREANLWVVLDLHGAPGGQTGTNIDDSPNRIPELYTDPAHRARCIAVWELLVTRYRDEPVVAGYDLLNEPIPNEYQDLYADELVSLYRDLTAAIRAIDPDHLIIYEGSHWSTNWSIFTEVWDPNSMLQFHKYWSPPDRPSILHYIERGRELGLPVYMGEGGENNREWIATVHELYEQYDISWNHWPWKKVETHTSPYSIVAPEGWDRLVACARVAAPGDKIPPGGFPDDMVTEAEQPSAEECRRILTDFLTAIRTENCVYRADVVAAMLRRAPVTLPATAFGFDGPEVSYSTTGAIPAVDFRFDDEVTIVRFDGVVSEIGFGHVGGRVRPADETLAVVLADGEWAEYAVWTQAAGSWEFAISLAEVPDAAGAPRVVVDAVELPLSPGDRDPESAMSTLRAPVELAAGRHTVRVVAPMGRIAFTAVALN